MPIFMFTDIEGSTRLWESQGRRMTGVLSHHYEILSRQIAGHAGRVVKQIGDGTFAAFEGGEPIQAAIEIQKECNKVNWDIPDGLKIRIALHAGPADRHGEDYLGPAVNRTQRLMEISWGGQILVTPEVLEINPLPPRAAIKDHGPHLLRDMTRPQYVYEIVSFDFPLQHFPPLRSLSSQPQVLPEAVKKARDIHVDSLAVYALIGVARLMESEGRFAQAVEVVSLVLVNSPSDMIRDKALALMKDLEPKLLPIELAEAAAKGRALDLAEYIKLLLNETNGVGAA
jgi:hypothetical protein